MADKRKLQGEMERCYKKVTEGVETFEDIWMKLSNANNTNQKDKYESDLKKEIKKLQRLRDQIKTWAASNEVKDKRLLLENRKLIETQMERFKVVERETKTKAYSKEGLGLAAKKDPEQKEREETMQWLQSTIDAINRQVDMFESEIESFNSISRKKKLTADKTVRQAELVAFLEKHRYHIRNLETLMRMLDNETISADKINIIRDDIEYYMEACQDPDYEDNEFIYEDMGLDESIVAITATAGSPGPGEKISNTSLNNNSSKDEDEIKSADSSPTPQNNTNHSTPSSIKEEEPRKRSKSDDLISPHKPINNIQRQTSTTPRSMAFQPTNPITTNKPQKGPPPTAHSQPYAAAAGGMQSVTSNHVSQTQVTASRTILPPESPSPTKKSQAQRSFESSWHGSNHSSLSEANNVEVRNAVNSIVSSVASLSLTSNPEPATSPPVTVSNLPDLVGSVTPAPTEAPHSQTPTTNGPSLPNGPQTSHVDLSSLKSMAEQAIANAGLEQRTVTSPPFPPHNTEPLITATNQSRPDLTSLSVVVQQQQTAAQQLPMGGGEARIQPLLGVAPLGPVSLSKENMYQQAMLDACWRHMPHPSDSERLRHYLPRNPCPTPSYYHQTPLPHHDSVEFYLRLSTETLFFIFYYMEATKAQYMAAKALKKQSWRFHTKYMMWFQRHEEPKTITDEYEQGTYIYFDYEKWGQRKKEGFTFEYRYLEDRELQ
uniref:CCR4-NOT transcription complex subunit 3-like n=1 Tax=Ciona intestinalis TaxID=7719 RepID=UPI000180B849|nr:CCR4-NOT transcription complex subunit 3-like [Ciona intestinalis]|eukprot:XP_002128708.1 CCR4-NOT transcription complex subunit 3-like [Ciona intestinalis]